MSCVFLVISLMPSPPVPVPQGPARRGSTGSDLPDIDEEDVFNEPLPEHTISGGGNSIGGGRGGGGCSNHSSSPDRAANDGEFSVPSTVRGFTQIHGAAGSSGGKPNDASSGGGSAVEGLEHGKDTRSLRHVPGGGNAARLPPGRMMRRRTWDPATFMSNRWTGGTTGTIGWNAGATTAVAEAGAAATLTGLGNIREDDGGSGSEDGSLQRHSSWGRNLMAASGMYAYASLFGVVAFCFVCFMSCWNREQLAPFTLNRAVLRERLERRYGLLRS